ncbi:hypothetical protein BV372_35055 [Nostoc sp. T09]|nr:hypothetical protein BV372_35055 [Nostoc sp. T09]
MYSETQLPNKFTFLSANVYTYFTKTILDNYEQRYQKAVINYLAKGADQNFFWCFLSAAFFWC